MTAEGTYTPSPGAAPLPRMLRAQARLETRMVLRNGEQLLLTVVIPVLVLLVFGSVEVVDLGGRSERLDFLVPGVLALAVLSTAFTGLAIGTGFERRYGALKRLGATPLPRGALLAAKGLAVLAVEALQVVLLLGGRAAARLGPAARRRGLGRGAAAAAGRHRCLRRARAADGRHAAGRGDARRGQPGLPAAARHRRHRGAPGPVPGRRCSRCSSCCRPPRSPRGCGTACPTAPGSRSAGSVVLLVWGSCRRGAGGPLVPLGVGHAGRPVPWAHARAGAVLATRPTPCCAAPSSAPWSPTR